LFEYFLGAFLVGLTLQDPGPAGVYLIPGGTLLVVSAFTGIVVAESVNKHVPNR
jgi:hypothetical protein